MIESERKIVFSNKRELTKSNNRSLIITSGINVFVEKGVAEATVRDIIRSTGLASGTFSVSYTHLTLPTKRIV